MTIPNFFLLGAPKCGTSALYEYLREHPSIFMPRLKEPHFFSTDIREYGSVQTEEDYRQLFAGCDPEHSACGEASVFYLYSTIAVRQILAFNPAAKFLAVVRNPVEMYPSLHSQFLYTFYEDETDCETAWRLQAARLRGERIPELCQESRLLQYAAVCSLGEQIARLVSQVPAPQRKIIVFDDLKRSPRAVYEDVLSFLGLPPDGRTVFPLVNERKSHKNGWIGRFLQSPPRFLHNTRKRLKRSYYLRGSLLGRMTYGFLEWSRRFNSQKTGRSELSPDFAAELAEAFRDDVQLLSSILQRDLSHWLTDARPLPATASDHETMSPLCSR